MAASRKVSVTRQRRPFLLYLIFVLTWAFASVMIVTAVSVDETDTGPAETTAWFFVAGTGVLVVAFISRDLSARRESHGLLAERDALIASIGVVTDPRLTQLPLYRVLDELLNRARTVLRADTAAVFLVDDQSGALERTAASGIPDSGTRKVTVAVGEGVIGKVAESRRAIAIAKAPSEPAIAMCSSLLAAPLIAEGKTLGVLQIGTVVRRQFGDDELRLLQLVADRAAVAIEGTRLERAAVRSRLAAEGARTRLKQLADAGAVLGRSFDDARAMVTGLGDALVPEFLDWFAFHEAGERVPPLEVERAGDAVTHEVDCHWQRQIPDLLADGEPHLVWGKALLAERWEWARDLGLGSVIAVPVRGRQAILGELLLGSAGSRRGLRPGDLSTAVDLAARIAVAIERVQLVIQTQQSAIRAARQATHLQRLTGAAAAVNAALDTDALASLVAEQAAHVLDAQGAWVDLIEGRTARRVAEFGARPKRGREACRDLTDSDGRPVGELGVVRRSPIFSTDEQAVLESLAQTASVALVNARLYGAVQASEARLRALYDASPVGIVELDGDGRAVRWNRAAESLFGWPAYRERLAGTIAAPDAARDVVAGALAGSETRVVDVRLGEVDAELVAVPLPGPAGVGGGAVLAVVDVTERKQVAEQLQQAHRMESMARMAGGIAHDFNNVLMVIMGYADLALRRKISAPVRDDIERMRAAADRAAEFTRKLLAVSRRQIVQAQRVDVASAVRSLDTFLPVMLGDNIVLDLQIDTPPPVMIDPSQLEQVVLNLAINARDAMPRGGRLEVRARAADDGRIAELVVADDGEGMDADTMEHCFEPFFTTKDPTKGSGLGLSTVYGVVSQLGGEIAVDSTVGAGTTFTIRLPAASGDVEVEPDAPRVTSPMRILVVDDEPDVRAIVADMLELDGHEVTTAADGHAALAVVAESAPDVLLSDVVMPGMRGTELARLVLARAPKVRVILMSSHVDDELALDPDVEGALFLAKPFSPAALTTALIAATAIRRRRRAPVKR